MANVFYLKMGIQSQLDGYEFEDIDRNFPPKLQPGDLCFLLSRWKRMRQACQPFFLRFDLSMVDSANNSAEPVKHPRYYLAFL